MKATSNWLIESLELWRVDTSLWGTSTNKSVLSLLEEINNNEAGLLCFQWDVSRCAYVSTWDVYYTDLEWQKYKLHEKKQVFTNWWVKVRNLPTSISEKSGRNEDEMVGIIRAVKEELWLTSANIKSIINKGIIENSRESLAYPWLLTKYILAQFEIILDWSIDVDKWFKEVKKEKTIHFIWKKIEK